MEDKHERRERKGGQQRVREEVNRSDKNKVLFCYVVGGINNSSPLECLQLL